MVLWEPLLVGQGLIGAIASAANLTSRTLGLVHLFYSPPDTASMRRAAFQAVRSVRRPCLRKFARSRVAFALPSNGLAHRSLHHSGRPRASPTVLTSSMQFRAITGALVAAAVASGAFYAYNGNQSPNATASPINQQSASLSSQAGSEPTRKALVVGQGELYTGTITGSGPISKETDEYGRRVVEMLDPEQATAKLRKNEGSWRVGRGAGVVRYDVVQLVSLSSPQASLTILICCSSHPTTRSRMTTPRRSSRCRPTWLPPTTAPLRATGCSGACLTDTGT
jgi:hypothetical protein